MNLTAVLAQGRALAEARMTDECVIRRKSGTATHPDSGAVTDTFSTVYSGPCRVKSESTQARVAEAGERLVVLARPELHLPVSATGVRVGDLAEVTSSDDPELEGRTLRVTARPVGSQTTARRFPVEEAQT